MDRSASMIMFSSPHGLVDKVDKEAYKRYTSCAICKMAFGLANKKKCCKFCYEGVCTKCSPRKGFSETLNKNARLCDNCYRSGIENNVKKNFDIEQEKSEIQICQEVLFSDREINKGESIHKQNLLEKQEKLKIDFMQKEEKLTEDHERAAAEHREVVREVEDTAKKLEEIKYKKNLKEGKVKRLKDNLDDLESEIDNDKNRIDGLENAIQRQIEENRQIREALKDSKNTDSVSLETKELHLKTKINSLTQNLQELNIEKSEALQKVLELKKLREEKEKEFQQVVRATKQRSEDETLKELMKTINQQKKEIKELNQELAEKSSEVDLSAEQSAIASDKCHCVIF